MSFTARTVRSVISIALILSVLLLVSCSDGPLVSNKAKLPVYKSDFDSTVFYSITHKAETHTLDSRSNVSAGTFYIDARAPKEDSDAQQYQIVAIEDNVYQIISKLFGKAAKFSSKMQSSKLDLDNNRKTTSQQWKITKAEDDFYKIENVSTGKCLALVDGKIGQLPADDDNQEALLWKIKKVYAPNFAADAEWAEDFNGSSIDTGVWSFNADAKRSPEEVEADRGPDLNRPNLVERSTNIEENLSMKKKSAVLTLNKAEDSDDITGVSFNTKGNKDFTYGRFEVWAKLPAGEASQASVYLACEEGEPNERSEFNIIEFFGGDRDSVVSNTAHYKHNDGHNVATASTFELPRNEKYSESFHLFAIEWDETQIRFYVDGIQSGALPFNSKSLREAFQRPHFIGMNISAIAPYDPNKSTLTPDALKNTYPQHFQIDSIKYYPLVESTEE